MREKVERFLQSTRFAVVGASKDRSKYGNKCLRCYAQNGRNVVGVNPRESEIEGLAAYPDLASIPQTPQAITVVTPPRVTLAVLDDAESLGIEHIWLQPGSESPEVLARAEELGLGVIAGGPCVLVALGFRDA